MQLSILKKRLFDTAIADILRAMDGCSLVGAMTLSVCVVDYLANLRPAHKEGNSENYVAAVNDFLKTDAHPYEAKALYAYRCALVHVYGKSDATKSATLDGFLMKHLDPAFHLSGSDRVLRLNVESFVTDTVWAAWQFFDRVSKDPRRIEENGNKLLIIYHSDAKADKPYETMHRALKELDKKQPDYDTLFADIRETITEC